MNPRAEQSAVVEESENPLLAKIGRNRRPNKANVVDVIQLEQIWEAQVNPAAPPATL